ncbi:MAG: phospholipid carrier-dependent glycosyltransferase [Elusimicrobia bacterium]|nr:phospholipid carrier-dependent glycosyltransferase [Elusimicrobiota bacterium]
MSRGLFAWLLGGILLFTLAARLYRLNVPAGFYFDEVYSAFTAVGYLHGEKGAYWPWTPHAEGVGYQWVHPPLAGLLMAAAMKAGGENAVSWRLGSVLAGTAAVALAAALALELFSFAPIALFAAFFLSVDGLSFTQSRIATNDGYFAAFALLAVWSYVRWKKDRASLKNLILTGLCLGLAAAVKWTAFYLFGVICLDLALEFFTDRRAFLAGMTWPRAAGMALCWLALPVLIYIAAYSQFFLLGYDWGDFLALQREMWIYHTRLAETHTYQAGPLEWVFNLRPTWFYVDRSIPGKVANIYNTGNSAVYFAGLAAVFVAARKFMRRREHRLLLTAYFMLWAPWLLAPRLMFFYHYTPAVPFLCILLAWLVENLRNPGSPDYFNVRGGKALAWGITVLAFLWFALFYPLHTALPVPERFAKAGCVSGETQ